jgi:hypothetical protein
MYYSGIIPFLKVMYDSMQFRAYDANHSDTRRRYRLIERLSDCYSQCPCRITGGRPLFSLYCFDYVIAGCHQLYIKFSKNYMTFKRNNKNVPPGSWYFGQ